MSTYPERADGRVDQQGNPLPDTIADLALEPTLTVGRSVIVICSICDGDPEYRSRFDNEACWRCDGQGVRTLTVEQGCCPSCDTSFLGEQIALKHMSNYGSTHFSKKMGLYANDRTQAWLCRTCGLRWSRWTGRVLRPEEPVELLHLEPEGIRYVSGTGQVIGVHREVEDCRVNTCCIHNPSNHPMRDWPTHYNWDLQRMERVNPRRVSTCTIRMRWHMKSEWLRRPDMSIDYTAYAFYGEEMNQPPTSDSGTMEWYEADLPAGLSHVCAGDGMGGEGPQHYIVLTRTLRTWDVKHGDLPSQTKLPVRRDGEDSDELYALLKQGDLLNKTDANSEGWHFAGYVS